MTKIAVVLVHYKGIENTQECLLSLRKTKLSKDTQLEIIIVNNSPKDSLEKISHKIPSIIIINAKENLGFAEGNNVGIREALLKNADFVLLLNNDTIVKEDFLQVLLSAIQSNDQIGIVVPKIYFAKGCEFHKDRYKKTELGRVIWYAGGFIDWNNIGGVHRGVDEIDIGQYNSERIIDFATGCCMLLRKEVFEKVGLFDPRYFLYYEDADLSVRVKKQGYSIHFIPDAQIWHKNAGSSGSGSNLHDYYLTRNRLLFGMKYASIKTKLALLRQSFYFLLKGRQYQKKGVLDFMFDKMGKGIIDL